jgi:hypothetical protein
MRFNSHSGSIGVVTFGTCFPYLSTLSLFSPRQYSGLKQLDLDKIASSVEPAKPGAAQIGAEYRDALSGANSRKDASESD